MSANWICLCIVIFASTFSKAQVNENNDSIDIILKMTSDTSTVNLLNALSQQYLMSNLDKANKYAEAGFKLADQLHYTKGSATSLKNIGSAYYHKGSYQKAMNYFEESLKLFKNSDNKNGVASILDRISRTYKKLGDYEAAMKNSIESVNIYRALNDQENMAAVLNNIATISIAKGDYETAMKTCFQSLKIYETLNQKNEMSTIFQNIGNIYYYQDNLTKAGAYYQKALEIKQRSGDKIGMAANLNNIGMIYHKEKNFDQAIEYYKKALKIREEFENKEEVASSLMNIGAIYSDWKKYEDSKKYIQNALHIYEQLNYQAGLSIGYGNLGNIYLNLGKNKKAIDAFDQSSFIARKIGDLEQMKFNFFNLSELYKVLKNYQKAYEYYQQYILVKDSLSNTEKIAIINELEEKYKTEKKENEITKLTAEREQQDVLLDKQNFKIVILSISIICMIIFIFLLYSRNKFKQKIVLNSKIMKQQELILKTTVYVQEQERKKIAKDLHDNIGYLLTGLRLSLEKISNDVTIVFPPAKPEFEMVSKLLDTTYSEMHSISHQIALPMALDKYGLIPAMEEMLNICIAKTEIQFEFEHFQITERFEEDIEIAVYRITQELVNNVIKHSDADTLTVQLIRTNHILVLLVEDNGKGFNTNERFNGQGLTNIKTRVDSVKGVIDISSKSGAGTIVTINVPLI